MKNNNLVQKQFNSEVKRSRNSDFNSELTKYEALSVAKYLLSLDENREYFNNKRTRNKITSNHYDREFSP